MNARRVALLQSATDALLLLLAFALPVAVVSLDMFDPTRFKALTLQALGILVLGLIALKILETGRIEAPANRLRLAAPAAAFLAWIVWSFARNPVPEASLFPAAQSAASVLFFLVILTQSACADFAASLSDWTCGAAGLVAAVALIQTSGFGMAAVEALHLGLINALWPAPDGRAFSTLGRPDLLGAFLGAAFPLALSRSTDPERSLVGRAASAAAALACLAGVLAANSPAGALTLCAGASAYAALSLGSQRDLRLRSTGLAAAAAVPLVVWAAFAVHAPAAAAVPEARPGRSGSAVDPGGEFKRRVLWDAAVSRETWSAGLDLWRDHQWAGVGAGGFATAVRRAPPETLLSQAGLLAEADASGRSEPLETAAELGAVGLSLWALIFLGSILVSLRDLARRARRGDARGGALLLGQAAGMLALLAAGGVTGILRSPAPGVLLWLLAGSAAGLSLESGAARAWVLPIPAPPRLRRLLFAPVLAAAAWALAWPVRFYRSDGDYNRGVYLMGFKRYDEALERLDRVQAWHPDAAMARYIAGYLYEDRISPKNLGAAMTRYLEAERLAPTHAGIRYQLGQAYAARGDWENAAKSYRECLALDPRNAQAYAELADALQILGRKEEALAAARERLRALPDDPASWRFLAEQYRSRKEFRLARRMLNKASRVDDVARAGGTSPVY